MAADPPRDDPIRRMHAYPMFFDFPHAFTVKSFVTSTYGIFISHFVMQVMQVMHFQYFRRAYMAQPITASNESIVHYPLPLCNSPTGWCTEFFVRKCGWTQWIEALHGMPSLRRACACQLSAIGPLAPHSNAVVSGKPNIKLKFCTAAPAAPLIMLSSALMRSTRPRTILAVISTKFV